MIAYVDVREFLAEWHHKDTYPPEWQHVHASLTEDIDTSGMQPDDIVTMLEASSTYDEIIASGVAEGGVAMVSADAKVKLKIIDGLHRVVANEDARFDRFVVDVYRYIKPEDEELGERMGQGMCKI